jgi:hypothetical protein
MTDRKQSRGAASWPEMIRRVPARKEETRSAFDPFYRRCSRSTACTSLRRKNLSMGGNTGPTKARSLTSSIRARFTCKDGDRNLRLNSSETFDRK